MDSYQRKKDNYEGKEKVRTLYHALKAKQASDPAISAGDVKAAAKMLLVICLQFFPDPAENQAKTGKRQ